MMKTVLPKFVFFLSLAVFLISFSGTALARSCKKDLPKEVFKFFTDSDLSNVDCDNYDYTLVDLNEDDEKEIIVYKKQFSCTPKGRCDSEVFKKTNGRYVNIGTLAGRYEIQKTKTDEYLDISVWTQADQLVTYRWNGFQYKPENFAPQKTGTATPAPTDPWSALP